MLGILSVTHIRIVLVRIERSCAAMCIPCLPGDPEANFAFVDALTGSAEVTVIAGERACMIGKLISRKAGVFQECWYRSVGRTLEVFLVFQGKVV